MHQEMPIVFLTDNMQNAILEMTKYGYGCVGIVDNRNKLVGIITDGDLRRKMNNNIMSSSISEIMTYNPISVNSNITSSELLNIMENKKITNVFVVNKNEMPIGIIHIHDLLVNKIA